MPRRLQQRRDWFSVTAPDDGRAHVIELKVVQDPNVRAQIDAYASADGSLIGSAILPVSAVGVTRWNYITVGPGTTTLIRLMPWSKTNAGGVTVDYVLTPENDEHEPNDDPGSASSPEGNVAAMSLATDVHAQIIRPYELETDGTTLVLDVFEIELEALNAGNTNDYTLTYSGVDGARLIFRILDAAFVSTNIVYPSPIGGGGGAAEFNVPTSGTYRIVVSAYNDTAAPFFSGSEKPAYLADQYSFRIDPLAP